MIDFIYSVVGVAAAIAGDMDNTTMGWLVSGGDVLRQEVREEIAAGTSLAEHLQ